MKLRFSWVLLFVLSSTGCQTHRAQDQALPPEVSRPEPSQPVATEVVLDHGFFVVSYNPKFKIANWVRYHSKKQNLQNKVTGRSNRFHADPLLKQRKLATVEDDDYKRSGYQRGHLAPSADFEWSREANDKTFVMTNMAPQKAGLNMFAWRYLETRVRKWTCTENHLQVIVGPVLKTNLERLPSGVAVPEQFFKVILDETPPRKALGFIYNQTDRKDVYQDRMMTVDEVEQATGLDFYSEIPDAEENKIESVASLSDWKEKRCW